MRRNYIRENEKPSFLPHLLTYQWCSTSLDYYTDYIANCMNVTRDDIRRVIAQYVTGKPFVAGLIINADMSKASSPSTFFKP
jgi:zinc protease